MRFQTLRSSFAWCFACTFWSCSFAARPVASCCWLPWLCCFLRCCSACHGPALVTVGCFLILVQYFRILEDQLSQENEQRILRNLITVASRELAALLLKSRPSRELQTLQPIPSFFCSFWIGALWPCCPEPLQQNYWWYVRELYERQQLLRDLLLLVDQRVEGNLLHLAKEVDLLGDPST